MTRYRWGLVGGCSVQGSARFSIGKFLLASGFLFLSTSALAGMSASPNPSSTGNYTVSWTTISGASKYQLYEDSTLVYNGTALSYAVSGKSNGTYTYSMKKCTLEWVDMGPGGFWQEICGQPSGFSNISVTVNMTPAVPTGLNVPSTNYSGSYSAIWNSVSGATSYTLQQKINSGGWSTVHSGSATSKSFSGKSNATYHYRVRACNASGCSAYSGTDSVQVIRTPGVPGAISGPSSDTNGAYSLSWGAASGTVTKYTLQRKLNSGGWSTIQDNSSTSRSESGRTDGTWYYRVRACNTLSCSGWTATKSVVVYHTPGVPGAISGPSSDTDGAYSLSWSAASGTVTKYTLQRKLNSGGWSTIQDNSSTSRSESGRTDGTWYYRVRACNSLSCSAWTSNKSVLVTLTPSVPGGLNAPTNDTNGAYTVSWNSSTGTVTKYTLQRRLNSGSWSTIQDNNSTSRSESGLADGTWHYRVRACNDLSCSGWSGTDSTNVVNTPSVPGAISGPTTDTDGSYTLSWSASTGAVDTYTLQEQIGSGSWSTIQNTSATSRTLTGKSNDTYSYRVRACNSLSCSSYGATKVVTVDIPAGQPGTVSGPATDGDGSYTLSWAAASGMIDYYQLQEQVGSTWSQIYQGTAVSHAVSGRGEGTYQYRVRGYYQGNYSSWASPYETVEVIFPPGAPTGLTGPGFDDDGVYDVSWSAGSGTIDSYTLQERVDGGAWSTVSGVSGLSHSFSGKTDATYGYRVRSCNVSGCSGYTAVTDVLVDVPNPNTPPSPQVASAPVADAQSDEVGVTAGSFRVDESGSATYSIPILTAPGIAGVVPQVSLNYSSQAGPGIAGVGWSIGGLSAITRCRQTIETDNNNDGIHLDANDRYCMDGQRLVQVGVSGSDIEYRTEVDQFAKIIGYGATSGDPTHFVVWRKDGSVSEYGDTTDSRMEAVGTSIGFTWAQNEFADNVGNTITYEYTEDTVNGSQLIDRIVYAGGDAEILFTYEALPSGAAPRTSYVAGSQFTSDERLLSIESRNNLAELRTYTLTYDVAAKTNRSRLTQIEECNGTVCYEPTTFDWAETTLGVDYNGLNYTSGGVGGMQLADLNGDGVNEVLFLEIDEGSSDIDFYVRVMRFNSSNGRYEQGNFGLSPSNPSPSRIYIDDDHLGAWTVIDYNNDGNHDLMYIGSNQLRVRLGEDYNGLGDLDGTAHTIGTGYAVETLTVADYDGDGLPDILDGGPNEVQLLKEDPNGTATLPYHFEPATQMTGLPGCYADFFTAARCNTGFYAISTQEATPLIADFNADGVVDLFREELYIDVFSGEAGQTPEPNRTVWTLYASKNGSQDYEVYHAFVDLSWNRTAHDFKFGDFNGDGLTDIAYRSADYSGGQANWSFQLNSGDGFDTPQSLGTYGLAEAKQIRFIDFNGDGASDMFYIGTGSTTWTVREWSGSGFDSGIASGINAKPTSGADIDRWTTAFFDANGDGKLDAINAKSKDDSPREVRTYIGKNPFLPNDMIDKITNGFGAETDITYTAISDPDHPTLYTRGTDANTLSWGNSPVFDLQHPMYVARQVESSAPAAGSTPGNVDYSAKSSISYRYGEYKIQSGGRGSLGFGFVVSVDDQTQFETTTHYRQDFPYIGRSESTEVKTGNDDRLSYATNTWDDHNASGPNRQPFLSVAVEQSHATDTTNTATGAFSVGSVISTTTTTTTMHSSYGQYGDVGSVITETVAQGYTYKKTTTNTYYAPDLTNWHTGRLERTTVVHDRNDNSQGTVTRVSEFEYDAVTGLLTREIIEPNQTGALTLTTTYTHDSYGNVTQATQNGYRGFQLPGETEPTTVDRIARTFFDVDGRYSTYTENHYGHQQTVISRNDYGAVTEAEDAIGNRARTAYGAMGRQYWSGDDVGGFSRTVHRDCVAVSCPTGAQYRLQTLSAGGGESMTYYDVLGREIRTAARMFDGNWSISVQEYDALGRVVHSSEPFSASTPSGGTPVYWTKVVYDDLGRPTQTTHPDLNVSTADYDGFDITNTDPNGKTRKEFKNALGELVRAEDHLTGWVTYAYDEQGNLTTSTAGGSGVSNVVSTMGYDLLGRKTSMNDANMGNWSYDYNAFGELIRQTTGTGDNTEMSYDRLGRMVRRIDYEGSSTEVNDSAWIYDTAPLAGGGSALGQLHIEDSEVLGATPISRTFTYDQYGRGASATTSILHGGGTEDYVARTTYDQYGRVFQSFDGAQAFSGLEYTYNQYGFVERVDEAANSASVTDTLYEVIAMDARGNVTVLDKGPLTVTRTFEPDTGRPTEIFAQNALTQTVQNLDLDWDAVGNLLEKHDQNRTETGTYKNIVETYAYDDLYRLETVTQGSVDTLDMAYDALGNITQKNAFTSGGSTDSNATVTGYAYTGGTHRLSAANGSSYSYDGNGSVLSGGGRSITWGVHNKPTSISKSGRTVHLNYGPNRSRYKRVDDSGQSGETTTHYAGSIERIWRPGGIVETKRYLAGEAIVTRTDDNGSVSEDRKWLLTDHLGSTDLLVDESGQVAQAMSFDAFGSRRSAVSFASYSATSIASFDVGITTKGFTGHEGLDGVGLVHMNGRVYDPLIGRFISADPFVQAPGNTQSQNRYAYVYNNPLSHTDPSGYFSFKEGLAIVAAIAVSVVTYGAASGWAASFVGNAVAQGAIAGAVSGAAAGFVSGAILTGTASGAFTGAAFGALSGAAFGAIGGHFKAEALSNSRGVLDGSVKLSSLHRFGGNYLTSGQIAQQITLHSIAGGVLSVAQGGKFGHGFASAFVTKATTNVQWHAEDAGAGFGAASAAVIGGTTSVLSGGKFANGAGTAAFQYLFNAASDGTARRGESERINLTEHEDIDGAHTIREHVGKSDQFLLGRMRGIVTPRGIVYKRAHSSFPSLEAAEKLVSSTIAQHGLQVSEFLKSKSPQLVINSQFKTPTGRVAFRKGSNNRAFPVEIVDGTGVTVVLRRNASMPNGFVVHTSYPSL